MTFHNGRRWVAAVGLAVGVLWLAGCSLGGAGGAMVEGGATVEAVEGGMERGGLPAWSLPGFAQLTLNDLSPAAADAALRQGGMSVAVVLPAQQSIFTYEADRTFDLASVAKIPVLLTALDRRERQQRAVTPAEVTLMERTITASDNDAATTLFLAAGGRDALNGWVRRAEVGEVLPDANGQWGLTGGSSRGMATLLYRLAANQLVNPDHTGLLLGLLQQVTPSQRFGTGEVLDRAMPPPMQVAVKNGWLDQEGRWLVTSVALVRDGAGQPVAAVAVFADGQPSLEAGVARVREMTVLLADGMKARTPVG